MYFQHSAVLDVPHLPDHHHVHSRVVYLVADLTQPRSVDVELQVRTRSRDDGVGSDKRSAC